MFAILPFGYIARMQKQALRTVAILGFAVMLVTSCTGQSASSDSSSAAPTTAAVRVRFGFSFADKLQFLGAGLRIVGDHVRQRPRRAGPG